MESTVSSSRELRFESPEIQSIVASIMNQEEARNQLKKLTAESFRKWLCEMITAIASSLGYVLKNLIYEIPADIAYSFKKGFKNGLMRAHTDSYRYNDSKK